MNVDDNWYQTRVTAEDMSELLGIPVKSIESFFSTVENVVAYRFYEMIRESGFDKTADYSVSVPYIGDIVISFDEAGNIQSTFKMKNTFQTKIKKSASEVKSSLSKELSKHLGKELKQRFEESNCAENGGSILNGY